MAFKCKLGIHSWNGCKCSECGKTREEQHDWSNDCEKCSICGKTKENQHDWSKDCEKCSKCGKTKENEHGWSKDCEKCSICGKTRKEQHNWDGCKCSICSKTRDEQHDWSLNCEKCSKCGKTRTTKHQIKDNKCTICGLVMTEVKEMAKTNLGKKIIQLSTKEFDNKYFYDAWVNGWECIIHYPKTWMMNETKKDIIIKPADSHFIYENGLPFNSPGISLIHGDASNKEENKLLNDFKGGYSQMFKGFVLIESEIILVNDVKTLIMYYDFQRSSGIWSSITTIRIKSGSLWVMDVSGLKEDIKIWDSPNTPLHVLSKLEIVIK